LANSARKDYEALQEGWLDLLDQVNEVEESLCKENTDLREAILAHIEKFQGLPERSGKQKSRVEAILESCSGLLENLDLVESGEYDNDEMDEEFLREHGIEILAPDIPRIEVLNRTPSVINRNPYPVKYVDVGQGKRCVYIWRLTGTNIFKVGVTSPHLGLTRLTDVINALGNDAEILRVICAENETDAAEIEATILASCAAQVPVDLRTKRLSGRYEFVEFFEHQISAVLKFMDANHHP